MNFQVIIGNECSLLLSPVQCNRKFKCHHFSPSKLLCFPISELLTDSHLMQKEIECIASSPSPSSPFSCLQSSFCKLSVFPLLEQRKWREERKQSDSNLTSALSGDRTISRFGRCLKLPLFFVGHISDFFFQRFNHRSQYIVHSSLHIDACLSSGCFGDPSSHLSVEIKLCLQAAFKEIQEQCFLVFLFLSEPRRFLIISLGSLTRIVLFNYVFFPERDLLVCIIQGFVHII